MTDKEDPFDGLDPKQKQTAAYYKRELARMFSDTDIRRHLGVHAPILKYPELANYQSIAQLLPRDKSFVVILVETERNVGHWCCMLRYGKTIESFDSYGGEIEHELHYVNPATKEALGETGFCMSHLIKSIPRGWTHIHNTHRLQELNDAVDTCGRWCCARIIAMRCGYTLPEFVALVNRESKRWSQPPDITVVQWTT